MAYANRTNERKSDFFLQMKHFKNFPASVVGRFKSLLVTELLSQILNMASVSLSVLCFQFTAAVKVLLQTVQNSSLRYPPTQYNCDF